MRKIPPSPFHGTSGFLLAEAPPQALIIADCPSAAADFQSLLILHEQDLFSKIFLN